MKKQALLRSALSLMLVLCFLIPSALPAFAEEPRVRVEQKSTGVIDSSYLTEDTRSKQKPEDMYKDTDKVRVSIVLKEKSVVDAGYSTKSLLENTSALQLIERLKENQKRVAQRINRSLEKKLEVKWNLTVASNIISADVQYGEIDTIEATEGVEEVLLETQYNPCVGTPSDKPNMAIVGDAITGVQQAWADGYTGAGARIAVIDTGLDIEHQSFNNDAYLYALKQNAQKARMYPSLYNLTLNLLENREVSKAIRYLNATERYPSLKASDARVSAKIPFAFNYVDANLDVSHLNDKQSEHGSHVAGIAAANRFIKTEKGYKPALDTVMAAGNAPDAQLLVMKVFGVRGGAYDSDYMAAVEDAVILGCDAVNLSLGSSSAGMANYSGASEYVRKLNSTDTVVVFSAGNNGQWAENTANGELYQDDINFDTLGSPASFDNTLSVASIDNLGMIAKCMTVAGKEYGYNENNAYGNAPLAGLAGKEWSYVLVDGYGLPEDFQDIDLTDKVVFCSRGQNSFFEKANNAVAAGAAAVIIYNNQSGTIGLNLTGYTYTAPVVSITQADGAAIKADSTLSSDGRYYEGTITFSEKAQIMAKPADHYTISDFSSWGMPGDLTIKPEITAPGGNIYSVEGRYISETGALTGDKDTYELMSGTSMAAPQITGMSAVLMRYLEVNGLDGKFLEGFSIYKRVQGDRASYGRFTDRALVQSLLMSTATPITGADDMLYPVFAQGAGLANVKDAMNTAAYILMNPSATASAADGKVKAELGDDPDKTGVYSLGFTLNSFKYRSETYTLSAKVFTQKIEDGFLTDEIVPLDAKVTFSTGKTARVSPLKKTSVTAKIALTEQAKDYLDENYTKGAYIEAYIFATPKGKTSTLSIPVLAYYGNWTDPSMYDKGSYIEYQYGLENRAPYLYFQNDVYSNAYLVKYAGSSDLYYFGGNMFAEEDTYYPERNSMNNQFGTVIDSLDYTLIRNAGSRMFTITDADTGEVYYSQSAGSQLATYYVSNNSAYSNPMYSQSIGWAGTDAEGNPLPDGTRVIMTLTAVPEYYMDAEGVYDMTAVGEGAKLSMPLVIDNTPAEIKNITEDADNNIIMDVSDNVAVAAVFLSVTDAPEALQVTPVSDTEATVTIGDELDPGVYDVEVVDYAGNVTYYNLFVDTEKTTEVESIELSDSAMVLLKNNQKPLSAKVMPITLTDRGVTFSSDDESVATVDAQGIVTGVGVGECTITVASVIDPTKTAICAVTVKELNKDLEALVWDENGLVWHSKVNTANLPAYDKLNDKDVGTYITATATGADGKLYAGDIDTAAGVSNLYTFDKETLAVDLVGTSSIAYTDMTEAPNLGNVLIGTYFNYVVLIDPTTGEYKGAFDYCSNDLVGIVYAGSILNTYYNQYLDTYYLLDSKGNVYYEAFITMDGEYYYFNGESTAIMGNIGVSTDIEYYQSMHYDGEMLYISNYKESRDSVNLYAVDIEATGEIFLLGNFGGGVWPVVLMGDAVQEAPENAASAALKTAAINQDAELLTEISR